MDSPHEEMASRKCATAAGLYAFHARPCPLTVLLRTVVESHMSERLFASSAGGAITYHVAGTRRVTRGPHRPGRLRGRRYLSNCGAAGGTAGSTACGAAADRRRRQRL